MALAAQLLGQSPRALGGPAQGQLRVPPCGRFDQGSQGGEEGRGVPFDAMPTAARGPHALGRQVILGPVRPLSQLTSARPDGSPGEACGFGDEAHATASQGLGLTSGPLTAEPLGHQRLKQLILRPLRFHGTGLAHTTRRVQDTRRSQRNRSSYFLTVPQKIGVLRLAPGPYVRLRDAKRRLNNPQAVSITRSTNPSLRLRNVSWTMRKTLMPPILCSTFTRIREMSRLDSFSSGVNSLPRGFFLG